MSVYSQEKYCPQGIMSETLKRKKKKENQKLPGGTELLIGSRRWIVYVDRTVSKVGKTVSH